MERIWGLYRHWAKTGYLNQSYQTVFYLYLGNDTRLTSYHLHDFGILERPQEIHAIHAQEPLAQLITSTIIAALV